ncbi:zf-HC2 domain-containing protein [Streptomyces sp. NRRL S-495]|uniref:anti-sigma factor family protein n=1 Tax=Streptomyces sp. NRRL S-495 TaxID=1609133 RepID=UPI0006985B28|nr:zf-HC2 domain-containing protein [Streptomyces sp. NRRL S-495]
MTAPPSSSDPTAGPHPSVDELADLSEELLAPAEAEALREHLAGCADCRETVDALTEVRALLGAAEPLAVPADVAARIDAALAAAVPATVPAAAPAVPAARPAPTAPPKAPPSRPAAGTGPGRSRRGRRRALLLGSAAALLVLGLGGAFLSLSSPGRQDLSSTADAAATPAAGTPAPESSTAGAKTDRSTGGTVYQDDRLAAQVGQLLAAAGTSHPVKPSAVPGSGPAATDPSEAPGATAVPPAEGGQGLVGGNRSTPACPPASSAALLATDRGSYAGAAADLLVYAMPGRPELLDVYLRAPDCGPVLRHLTVPAP